MVNIILRRVSDDWLSLCIGSVVAERDELFFLHW
jgi:hypothetical protein